jgi:hypothetical protein
VANVYHFEWRLRASPTALWPYVSDTQRLNEALGLPEWRFKDARLPEGGLHRTGAMRYMGLPVRWEEKPFEWTEGKELGVERIYETGPITILRSRVKLTPHEQGTLLQHSLEFEPRAFFWVPVARLELGVKVRRGLDRVYGEIDRYLAGESETAFLRRRAPTLTKAATKRLADTKAGLLVADLFPPAPVDKLLEYVASADDRALSRMRPLELADRWGYERTELLRIFLNATRRGLLTLAWDVICPSCRGAKVRYADLAALGGEAHCESCDVKIDTRAERALELVFTPSPKLRPLDVKQHCVGGPGNTPHVLWQRRLAPGEKALVALGLQEGTYRVRGPGIDQPTYVRATPAAASWSRSAIELSATKLVPEELVTGSLSEIEVVNRDGRERLLLLERAEWHDDAVTVGRALSLQDFVDLFPRQAPPTELGLTVGRLAIVVVRVDLERALAELEPDERAFASRELGTVLAETARARGGALATTDPPPSRGNVALAFPDVADAAAAAVACLEALAKHARERDLPDLGARAAMAASTAIARSRDGRASVQLDAVAQAEVLLDEAGPGEVVIDADLVAEAKPAVRLEPFVAPIGGQTRALVRLIAPAPPPSVARATRSMAATSEDAREDARVVALEELVLGDLIGHGGSAVVRVGVHFRSKRRFAVKIQSQPDDRAMKRFERELRAYSKLEGVPGICAVRGHGVKDGELWMALDLVEGRMLQRTLGEKKRFKVEEAARILAPVARALHAAHTRGVIHRDVKPGNIMIDEQGASWIVDFGIAHFVGEEKVQSGFYSGTLRYLPPESFEDDPVLDARSDIYALGLTFFEMVAGEGPFDGASADEHVVKIMSESAPDLNDLVPKAPRGAASVARHALRKRPTDRYRSAAEMALDLDFLARGETPLHAPEPDVDEGDGTRQFRANFVQRAMASMRRRQSP